jgi:hypothetical protein
MSLGWLSGRLSFLRFGSVDTVELVEKFIPFLFVYVLVSCFVIQVALSGNLQVFEALNPTVKLAENFF